jgi:ABC-type phosphate/phosphonate transport system substrate-binding protein
MRDTDRDLTSVIVVRRDDPARSLTDLAGRSVATGAIDSPQATLLPVALLISALGAEVAEAAVKGFDVGAGLHGDHIGGERDAARALAAGKVDAACMTDANHLLFTTEGTLAPNATRVVGVTATYDHCNMTVNGRGSPATERFAELLFGMDYADPVVRPLLDLEGLSAWLPGRDEGYAPLEEAVDLVGFYGPKGELTANGYRP